MEQERGPVDDVWVYEVVKRKDFTAPSPRYLDIITSAAEELGFPAEYRRYLGSIETTES